MSATGENSNPTGNGRDGEESREGTSCGLAGQKQVKKHNLHNKWTFWYRGKQLQPTVSDWEDNLQIVSEFWTVEDFWSVYHHITRASQISNGSSYLIFKHELKPTWEDKGNRRGGRWLIPLERKWRNQLDDKWLEVLLCLIGEAFGEAGDDICGAVMDIRNKADKISLWTANYKNEDRVLSIAKRVKERLEFDDSVRITYESHEDTRNKIGNPNSKPLYSLP